MPWRKIQIPGPCPRRDSADLRGVPNRLPGMLRLPGGGPYFELLSFRSPSIFNVQSCNLLFSRCVHIIAYVFSSFILADPRIPWSASLNSLLSHSPSDGHHHPLSPIGCCHDCSHTSLWMEQRVSPRLIPRSGDRGTISTYLHT